MIIAVINQKGGVGKTTTAVNLSAAFAESEQKVLLVDLDAQCNASALCGVRKPTASVFDTLIDASTDPIESVIVTTKIKNLDLVPGHRALAGLESALRDVMGREAILAEILTPLLDRYDKILIDNGPTLSLGPAMSLYAAHMALVPVQCQPLALDGLEQVTKSIQLAKQRLNPRLSRHILLTMLDGRKSHGKDIVAHVQKMFGQEVFATIIPSSAELERGVLKGGSVLTYASQSPAAAAYRALALEILHAQKEAS